MVMKLFLASALFVILMVGCQVCNANTYEDSCAVTLRISVLDDWPPYSWKNEAGEYQGIDVDFVTSVFSKLGFCWAYNTYPSSTRAFRELQKGNVDVIFAASYSEERAQWSTFSVPYRVEDMRVVRHISDKSTNWSNSNSTIVVNRGGYYGELFEQFKEQCSTCVYESNAAYERLNMVQNKRVRYALEDYAATTYIKKQHNLEEIEVSGETIHSSDIFLMLRPDALTSEQLELLNRQLEQHSKDLHMH
ncbi:transporter substrate-binding domain-containing protein [Alteromonas sp. KUL42]|uniref:substrate-binding periplasmic protein n=1 Tax=Alteromonas sp. KUL42 TaxID=2480797 RepID=UPI001036354D|nr:transporter substrate-binding domain-containing protein [Alteromonas sp. KUL42]TAP35159.1 transporter substrate-binding domain-containing protein [Alteromonas sp. KUL42]